MPKITGIFTVKFEFDRSFHRWGGEEVCRENSANGVNTYAFLRSMMMMDNLKFAEEHAFGAASLSVNDGQLTVEKPCSILSGAVIECARTRISFSKYAIEYIVCGTYEGAYHSLKGGEFVIEPAKENKVESTIFKGVFASYEEKRQRARKKMENIRSARQAKGYSLHDAELDALEEKQVLAKEFNVSFQAVPLTATVITDKLLKTFPAAGGWTIEHKWSAFEGRHLLYAVRGV